MPKSEQQRREQKNRIVGQMIRIYCRGIHKQKEGLCPACEELNRYAMERTAYCPNIGETLFCSGCRIHCYGKKEQEAIRRVMRYAGPRMLLYHPVSALEHLRDVLRSKRKESKP